MIRICIDIRRLLYYLLLLKKRLRTKIYAKKTSLVMIGPIYVFSLSEFLVKIFNKNR